MQNKDITRSIREFLWKCLHNAHKCGKFWEKIPNFEQRSICPSCKIEESMEHILLECIAPGQATIWNIAKTLWQLKHNYWPRITYGTITGCSMSNYTNDKGHKLKGKNRLFRIIVSESAHLIWRLRCERRIQNDDNPESFHSETEIHNRWVAKMNNRLTLDCLTTNKERWLVLQTWEGTLLDHNHLPNNWIRQTGVLVDIRPLDTICSSFP